MPVPPPARATRGTLAQIHALTVGASARTSNSLSLYVTLGRSEIRLACERAGADSTAVAGHGQSTEASGVPHFIKMTGSICW